MADTIILTADDSGASVTLEIGGSAVFELEENPTTGYRWQVGAACGVLRLEDDDFLPGKAIGAGGRRRLRFVAVAPGSVTVSLSLARPWAPDQSLATVTADVLVSR